ncbi:hypothetical protein ACLOJK_012301 [Asimina triloba]
MHPPTLFAPKIPQYRNERSVGFPRFPTVISEDYPKIPPRLLARPPRAASISGSGSEYAEQLLGTEKKQRRPSVAGVDQDELIDPMSLADPDSRFCEFKGLQMHHKVCEGEEEYSVQNETSAQVPNRVMKIGFPIILLHGFGASVFSWNQVMKPLAQLAGAKVLAFDRPAFGLTSRVSSSERPSSSADDAAPLNPYSTGFSVLATLFFIDFLSAEKAILMGYENFHSDALNIVLLKKHMPRTRSRRLYHYFLVRYMVWKKGLALEQSAIKLLDCHSAGCLVAVNAYFEAPERVAALILVAPAIFAPQLSSNASRQNQAAEENQREDGFSNPSIDDKLFSKIGKILLKVFMYIKGLVLQMVKGMMDMIGSLYKKALCAILHSSIALMLPLKVRDWDKALLEYTLAILTDSGSKSKTPLSRRLTEISCPVLIITGDGDRIVPAWNATRLSKAIPNACLEVIKNCGHLPHEERVDEFLSAVEKFLQRVFGGPEQQLRQATV